MDAATVLYRRFRVRCTAPRGRDPTTPAFWRGVVSRFRDGPGRTSLVCAAARQVAGARLETGAIHGGASTLLAFGQGHPFVARLLSDAGALRAPTTPEGGN